VHDLYSYRGHPSKHFARLGTMCKSDESLHDNYVVRWVSFRYNVHPCDKELTLSQNTTKIRKAGHELRLRYVRFVIVLEAI